MRRIFTLIISATLLVLQAKAQLGVFTENVGTGTSPSVNTYTGWTSGLPASNYSGTAGASVAIPPTSSTQGGSAVLLKTTTSQETQSFTISNIPITNFGTVVIGFEFRRPSGGATTLVQYSFDEGGTWSNFAISPVLATSGAIAWNDGPYAATPVIVPAGETTISIRFVIISGNGNTDRENYIDGIIVAPSIETLPVTTRNFTAVPRNGKVNLSWTGVATHMNSKFEVERSIKGNSGFNTISTLPAKAIGEAIYSFTDESPLKPVSHYRLRITDENGRVSYTKILKVAVGGAHFALDNLFPSVANTQVNLVVSSSSSQPTEVFVFDSYGRMVIQKKIVVATGSQSYPLDISRLNSGSYTVRLTQENEIITGKFIKQ
ncbi:T9SS type A sorting domain-containing protein [Flavihumibacter sp. ZG627]|uniref:T9SS type A sorting domain-containing protein n=1 Tax=Flavihumibacter sp. ZG627 TaxID=1463156 RepID=UPI00057F5C32|nr:T9SS type A sorting domain-containing protein [Flavihumibacter sp. ZG627]KIC89258.1 hypothetical protein HY58_17760 [Flavihumibacter sp. ZG627]